MEDVDIAMQELTRMHIERSAVKNRWTPPFELLTVEEVANVLRLSTPTIYRMINKKGPHYDSTFPEPLRLGARYTMFRADELTTWMLGLKRGIGLPINQKSPPK